MAVSITPQTVSALQRELGGITVEGLADTEVGSVANALEARRGDLAPLLSRRYLQAALRSEAVLLVSAPLASLVPAHRRWSHPHADWALATLLARHAHPEATVPADIHATAVVHSSAVVHPGATIGPDVVVGAHAVIYGRVTIEARALIGDSTVVGRPGFGWVHGLKGERIRMPQLGGVTIERDVEMGPLCTVDAGTLSPTHIGARTKIDAHCHIGHNVFIGCDCLIAAQTGFAGSVTLGDGCLVGGQAGFADHVSVGAGAKIAAKAGVIGDVPPGITVAGYPAVERTRWLRAIALGLRRSAHPSRDT